MLLVPSYLASSKIHGIGVFTAIFIVKGTRIWEFNDAIDWRISKGEMNFFPKPYQGLLRAYSYADTMNSYILCGDNAKFMNHSLESNCDDSGPYTIAKRDISVDEELTCDYSSFDLEFDQYKADMRP